jgi:hypothetical protein
LALLDLARQEVADPGARLLAQLGSHLAADRLDARLDAKLRDPGAHGAEPDHSDLAHVRHGGGSYPLGEVAPAARVLDFVEAGVCAEAECERSDCEQEDEKHEFHVTNDASLAS